MTASVGTILLLALATGTPGGDPVSRAIQVTPATSPDSVIDRVLAAYGGLEVIRAVDSYRQEGLLVALQSGSHGRVYRIAAGPDRLSVLMEYPDRSEVRTLESGFARRGPAPAAVVEVSGMLAGAIVLQAARAWLPWILDDRRSDAVVVGSAEGRTILDLRIADNLMLRAFVDEETSLIVRSESVLESAPGTIGFATDYSDFRSVSGVLFAFREETFASGIHTGSTVIESVEVNPRGERARLPVPKGL